MARTLAADRRARPLDPEVAEEQRRLREEEGKCGSRTKSKGLCNKNAGWGTNHLGFGSCKLHGGNMPNHQKAAQKHEAAMAVEQYGLPLDIDPFDALLEELARTSGHVNWLRLQVGTLTDEQMTGPVGQEGPTESGGLHHAKVEPSVWIRLYQEERKHLVSVAATCIKAGIEERRIEIAESQGVILARVINRVLSAFNISSEEAQPILRKELAMAAAEMNGDTIPGNATPLLEAEVPA